MKPFLALILFVFYSFTSNAQCTDSWLNIFQSRSCVDLGNLVVTGDQLTVEATYSRDYTITPTGTPSVDVVSKHSHGYNTGNVNYLLRVDHAEMNAGGVFYATPTDGCLANTDTNTLYHIAMVYDGVNLTFYRNGVIMSQVPATGDMATDTTVPTRIGSEDLVTNIFDPTLFGYINNVRIWNVALSQSQIEANIKLDDNGVLIDPIPAGLLGYYNFGSTPSANGSSGLMNRAGSNFNGFIGTVENAVTVPVTPAPAVIGAANPFCSVIDTCGGVTSTKVCDNNWLNITQSRSCVDLGNLVVSGNQLTVEATFSRNGVLTPTGTLSVDLVSKHSHGYNTGNVNYLLRVDHAEMNAGGVFYATPNTGCLANTDTNTTYHAAMVYDGTNLTYYRNGIIISQVPATGNMATDTTIPTRIGSEDLVTNVFDPTLLGYINNVRIWNVALSQSQIETNVLNDDKGILIDPIPTGLLGYYNFGSTQSANGSSGLMNRAGPDFNGFIGTVENAVTVPVTPAPAIIGAVNPFCSVVDSCGGVVPVILTSFNANVLNSESIGLQWRTEEEININNYTVQRSEGNANDFVSIGSVNSNDNLLTNNYSFIDKNVKTNTLYFYRLMIRDKAGSVQYSNISTAKIEGDGFGITILNNPVVNGQLKLLINGYQGNADIRLTNDLGQTVLSEKINSVNNDQLLLDLSQQPKGSYWIIVQTDRDKAVKSIIKL